MFWQSIGSFCWDPCEVGSRCLSRLQIFTPVCVQWRCVDLSVLNTPRHCCPPGVQTHLRKVLLSRWTSGESKQSTRTVLAGKGGGQSCQRHATVHIFTRNPEMVRSCPWRASFQELKAKQKSGAIKWEGLGGLFVILSVYIHTPSVEMTLHGRENPPGFGLNLSKLVCVHVSACMSVNWICIFVCVCVSTTGVCPWSCLKRHWTLWQMYIYYILSWATSWEYPHHDFFLKIPQIKTAEV